MTAPSQAGASLQLKQMFKDVTKGAASKDMQGISCGLFNDNIFEWEIMFMVDDDIKYYGGGFFPARLSFTQDFPASPPELRFLSPIPFHPNVYSDGRLCISILHPAGDDPHGYEDASERWNPSRSPEAILVSVLSIFDCPNHESPANVEAGRLLREDPKEFRKRVRVCVRKSQEAAGEA